MDLSFIEKRIAALNDLVTANAEANHPTAVKVEKLLNDLLDQVATTGHIRTDLRDIDRALLLITTSNMVEQLGYITNAMEAHNFVMSRKHELPLYTAAVIKQVEQVSNQLHQLGKPKIAHL